MLKRATSKNAPASYKFPLNLYTPLLLSPVTLIIDD